MKFGITVGVVSLALLGAALPAATGANGPTAHTAVTTVSVKATEFHFALSKTSVGHGKVTFKIKNAGHLKHDFKIAGKKSKMLTPGRSTSLTVTLKKGRYAYICTVTGHAAAGMKGKLTVK
jgi:uncharacterized cupredoxin-like copper-binding protein